MYLLLFSLITIHFLPVAELFINRELPDLAEPEHIIDHSSFHVGDSGFFKRKVNILHKLLVEGCDASVCVLTIVGACETEMIMRFTVFNSTGRSPASRGLL